VGERHETSRYPAIQDLVAGQVSMMFDVVPLAKPQLAVGKVCARGRLAAAAPGGTRRADLCRSRLPAARRRPLVGLMAPAGTPRAVVDWLNREAHKAFTAADVRERFFSQGVTLPLGTPEEFSAFVAAESNRWREIVRTAAIRME
jgi:tripartite-type tricarboxylate transporter receptor subunit TctC